MTMISVYLDGEFHEEANFEAVPRVGEYIYSLDHFFEVVNVWHSIDGSSQIQVEIDVARSKIEKVRASS